jgi:hypothetical protein
MRLVYCNAVMRFTYDDCDYRMVIGVLPRADAMDTTVPAGPAVKVSGASVCIHQTYTAWRG